MTKLPLSRRRFFEVTAAGIASAGARVARAADNVTIGSVYGGPRDDFGWNQAHAVAAKALKQVPGVKVVEEENVPETDACAKSMESMINLDGAELIFGTSFGYFRSLYDRSGEKICKRRIPARAFLLCSWPIE